MEDKAIIQMQFSRAEFDGAINMFCLLAGVSVGETDEVEKIWKTLSSNPTNIQDVDAQVFKDMDISKEQARIILMTIAICNAMLGDADNSRKALMRRLGTLERQ